MQNSRFWGINEGTYTCLRSKNAEGFNEDLTHPHPLLLLLPQNWTKLQFLIQKTGTGPSSYTIYLLHIYGYYLPRIQENWQRIDLPRGYSFFLTRENWDFLSDKWAQASRPNELYI